MNRITKTVAAGLIGLAICSAPSLMANPVSVTMGGVPSDALSVGVNLAGIRNPSGWVGSVYASYENLTVDGTPYQGYCIDLYHWSASVGSTLNYNVNFLQDSPTAQPPGGMGAVKADFIREMWQQYYAASVLDAHSSMDFQLAIWGVLQAKPAAITIANGNATIDGDFSWLTSGDKGGALAIIDWANNHVGTLADNLVGLNQALTPPTLSGGAQSFIIQTPNLTPPVPDGGLTAALLGMGLLGLGWVRRMVK